MEAFTNAVKTSTTITYSNQDVFPSLNYRFSFISCAVDGLDTLRIMQKQIGRHFPGTLMYFELECG